MNIINLSKMNLDRNKENKLNDEEWEYIAQNLINAKYDKIQEENFAAALAKNGILKNKKIVKRISSRTIISIAASWLILVAIGWFIYSSTKTNAQQFANQHLQKHFQLDKGNTRGQATIEYNREKAFDAYNNKLFEKSLSYLQIIESQSQAKASDYFQMGLCLMYQKNPDYKNAIKIFDKSKALNPDGYNDEINWFVALCYVMEKDKTHATFFLQKFLGSPSNWLSSEAEILLEKLK